MSSCNRPLLARSLAEAHFYLKVNPCPLCGKGSVEVADTVSTQPGSKDINVQFQTRCPSCGEAGVQDFVLQEQPKNLSLSNVSLTDTCPDDEPSTLIDVGQWVILYSTIMNEASQEDDQRLGRKMRIEAAACLEQALQMYDDPENDLPPTHALFHDFTRQRLRDNPELFSRQRLINLRAVLPSHSTMESPEDSC